MPECETCKKQLAESEVERDVFGRIECADCYDAQLMREKIEQNFPE